MSLKYMMKYGQITLKDEIESLIQRGCLPSRFIKKEGSKRSRDDKDAREVKKPKSNDDQKGIQRTPPREDKPTCIIQMILGGIEKDKAKSPLISPKVNKLFGLLLVCL